MSDSGFPQVPSQGRVAPQNVESKKAEPNVRLKRVPDELRTQRTPQRLRGEVVRAERQPSGEVRVTIRTQRGDIEVQIPKEQAQTQPQPRPGQQVEIEIRPAPTPDQPPQQAVLTIAPERPAPVRVDKTPVNVEVQDRPVQSQSAVTLAQGTTLQLEPVVFQDPQSVLSQAPADVLPALVTSEAFVQTLPQLPIEQILQQPALQALAPPASAQIVTEFTVLTNLQPVLPTAPLLTQTPAAPPTQQASAQPQAQVLIQIQNPAQGQTPPVITQASLTPVLESISNQIPAQPILTSQQKNALSTDHSLTKSVAFDAVNPPQITLADFIPTAGEQKNLTLVLPDIQGEKLIIQNQRAETFLAVVTGATQKNEAIITILPPPFDAAEQLPQQFFKVQLPQTDLVPGTRLELTPQSISVNAAALPVAPLPLAGLITPQGWPLLDDIQQALVQASPQVAQAMSTLSPSPANPAQMASGILFFVAALRSGDLSQWLGDRAMDILRKDTRLMNRIGQESAGLNRVSGETMGQDWRAMSLPLFWDNEFQKIALYYKQDQSSSDNQDQDKGKNTRFVFDLNLSEMGKVQLDALFKGERLDVILRTEQPFSQAMQAEMRQIYATALRETQVTGELSFQSSPEQWVTIQAQAAESLGVSA
jgi:hypothetical protein